MREAGPRMKNFNIFYLFEGTERKAVFPARTLHWATLLAPLQLMSGAVIVRIEEAA